MRSARYIYAQGFVSMSVVGRCGFAQLAAGARRWPCCRCSAARHQCRTRERMSPGCGPHATPPASTPTSSRTPAADAWPVSASPCSSAQAAREVHAREGLPPPRTTPYSLRGTYISVALRSDNYDVKWVMSHVGHVLEADSRRRRRHVCITRDELRRLRELTLAPDAAAWFPVVARRRGHSPQAMSMLRGR